MAKMLWAISNLSNCEKAMHPNLNKDVILQNVTKVHTVKSRVEARVTIQKIKS